MSIELKGKRIAFIIPELKKPASGIQLSPEAEESMQKDMLEKLDELEIAYVGSACELGYAVGDLVKIPFHAIEHADKTIVDGKLIGIINEYEIFFKWTK